VRVGAHPGVLPATVSAGTDFEKIRWTPGIYDSVSLALSGSPVIENIQVAPKIADSSIVVLTALHNFGKDPVSFDLTQRVHPWKSDETSAVARPEHVTLAAGETKVILGTLALPGARLWTPESPNLYVLETSTGGDTATTRFGMREFRFDTATKRAYLNGGVYFMRGSNITLHRFFEDPLSGTLPWDEAWVRKLLVEIPHEMHWNSFRFCIGPVPDRWLDIADEAGLLIQNEYFVWTGNAWHGPENQVHFDSDQMIREYTEWMRDNWNHPSVAIWDANNETWDSAFGEKIIPAVRGLDLSNRPWENTRAASLCNALCIPKRAAKKLHVLFPSCSTDQIFHLLDVLLEGSAASGRQPVFGTGDAPFEELVTSDVARFFQFAGVDAEIAVGGLEQPAEVVEA